MRLPPPSDRIVIVLLLTACQPVSEAVVDPWTDQGLALTDVIACEQPSELAYDDVGGTFGLRGAIDPLGAHHHGGSVVVADLDADNDHDVILGFPQGPPVLYRWDGTAFVPELLPGPALTFELNLADIDSDGDLDLLAPGYALPPTVLANDGMGHFEMLPMPPMPLAATRVRELAPGDLNGDGAVDLYAVTNSGGSDPAEHTDFVLIGDGTGSFSVAEGHDTSAGRGFDAVWVDVDADGDSDVYVVNDDGAEFGPNRLLRNDDGTLVNVGPECQCELVHFGMGGDAADINGDGLPDFYLTAVTHNVLMESQEDGTFIDTAAARGADPVVEPLHMGWGAVWLDHDNDGTLDVLVAQGDRWNEDDPLFMFESPLNLLRGIGAHFVDVGPRLGLPEVGSFRSVVAEDFNGDGVLDLFATEVVDTPRLFLSRGCTENAWLRVEAPPQSRVEVEAGSRRWTGWTTTESSFGGGHAPYLHVGLGDAATVDRVRVTGRSGDVLEAGGFAPRRTLRWE